MGFIVVCDCKKTDPIVRVVAAPSLSSAWTELSSGTRRKCWSVLCPAFVKTIFAVKKSKISLTIYVYKSSVVLANVSFVTTTASTVSTKSGSTTGSLQRSRSDIDVNAAASAKSKASASGSTPFSSAAALPPGSYASLGNQISATFPVCSLR